MLYTINISNNFRLYINIIIQTEKNFIIIINFTIIIIFIIPNRIFNNIKIIFYPINAFFIFS